MIGGAQPKLILSIDENGHFKVDQQWAELVGLVEGGSIWVLTKPEDPQFQKTSKDIMWLEFNEDRTFKAKYKKPAEGRSLIMSPFNEFFTWQTTDIIELIESKIDYWLFRTKNSVYLLQKLSDSNIVNNVESLEAQESI